VLSAVQPCIILQAPAAAMVRNDHKSVHLQTLPGWVYHAHRQQTFFLYQGIYRSAFRRSHLLQSDSKTQNQSKDHIWRKRDSEPIGSSRPCALCLLPRQPLSLPPPLPPTSTQKVLRILAVLILADIGPFQPLTPLFQKTTVR
jgi:hypothetical protein